MLTLIKDWISSAFLGSLFLGVTSIGSANSHSESMGIISFSIPAGSAQSPTYTLFSPGVNSLPVFRGSIKSSEDQNVTFYLTPDLQNPSQLIGPLPPGLVSSVQAKASTTIDENGSVSSVILIENGENYLAQPEVFISPPTDQNSSSTFSRTAACIADFNSDDKSINQIIVMDGGAGYQAPPEVYIRGGPHYLKILDAQSDYSGLYFPIISNTDQTLKLANPSDSNDTDGVPAIEEIMTPDLLVEVISGWTLGSLFGDNPSELQLHGDANASLADWVYILKDESEQIGNNNDFEPYFHDGEVWRLVNPPHSISSSKVINPQESVIIARRADSNTTIYVHGVSPSIATSWDLPESGNSGLVCNPFPVPLKLSELIGNIMITDDNSSSLENSSKWLAHPNQDLADNVQILTSNGWSTYWHDGSNLSVTKHAKISARAGSGIGGTLTSRDFSMTSGKISLVSNPTSGDVLVTTEETHGLSNGFEVEIASVLGRLTNSNKVQIDNNGSIVSYGEGLIVESPVNGTWEIEVDSPQSFYLKNSENNCDFIYTEDATWSTGNPGLGYDKNVTLSILGGGGEGAKAEGKVIDGKIHSIDIISGGLLYSSPPTILVHPGGWNKLGRGNMPINDAIIPANSGVLLIRKHPFGLRSRIPLNSFLPN
jgi:hypothetical protein